MWGGTKKFLYLQRTMEIGDQRGRGAASLEPRVDWGRNQKIFYLQRTMEIGDQRGRGAASFLCGNQPVCRVQLKAFLGNDVAALAPSSGEDPTLPRHRAGTRRKFDFHTGGDRGPTGGGTKRFFISRELWRLEIRAVDNFQSVPTRIISSARRVQLSRGLRGVDGDVRKRTRAAHRWQPLVATF